MNRSKLAALTAGAMFLVASVFVPVVATADTGNTNTIKVTGAPTINPPATGGSFTVSVAANGAVDIGGASAGLAFDNTKLQLTAIAKGAAPVANGAGFGGFPSAMNTAAFIADANTAGQIPNIGYFYTDGSSFDPANTDIAIFTATFSVTATGDTPLTLNQSPAMLDGRAATYGDSLTIDSLIHGQVVNSFQPIWDVTAPATASVLTGATTDVTVSTTVTQGNPGTINLSASGLPAGVTATFVPASGTDAFSSTLTFSATAGAAPGTYPIVVTADDGATTPKTATIQLTVVGNNDFGIGVSPTAGSVQAGGATSSAATVSTTILTGAPGTINLSVSGLPADVTATFTPASVAAGSSSSLTFDAAAAAVAGSYPLTITGDNGTYLHTASFTLNVIGATPAGGQNVNVTGTLDAGFLGLTCPTSLTIPLIRTNTNQINVPCVVYTNTVWNLNVDDPATDAYKGHMVTGRPVDGTANFHMADAMHVLADPYLFGGEIVYHNDVNLETGGTILTGTNSSDAPLVISQYVAPGTHPGQYGIQIVFSAVSVF